MNFCGGYAADKVKIRFLRLHQLTEAIRFSLLNFHNCKGYETFFFPQLYQEGPSEIARAGMTFEELQKRTGLAERTRDEALRRVDSLNSTLRKIETK